MTREEASRRYQIPLEILQEYESWGIQQCKAQYDNQDLERLCLITALKDLGFNQEETKEYLLLWEQEGTRDCFFRFRESLHFNFDFRIVLVDLSPVNFFKRDGFGYLFREVF